MKRIVAAGATDVGRVRPGNEDALLVRASVFAVADGMGGHVAGEVASATALEPISELDGKVFPDATAAVTALREAVVAANAHVSELAQREPSYHGMGTTLTAALFEGRRLHVAHVGDSRAYLLRDGTFAQLTDDHTLVQHLIDEGQITREEAAHHPQRSIVTRAIGVSPEVDVDSMSLELEPGDQLLLCSDGLTGVVDDADIARRLADQDDPDATVNDLVQMANDAGGPDNITVLLLRYEDPDAEARQDGEVTGHRTISITTRDDRGDGNWAGQLGTYGALARGNAPAPGAEDDDPKIGRLLRRTAAALVAIGLLGALVYGGGRFLLSRSFFVGVDGEEVVIFEGVNAEVGPFELYRVIERPGLQLDEVPRFQQNVFLDGYAAADLGQARRYVENVRRQVEEDAADAEQPAGGDDTAGSDDQTTDDTTDDTAGTGNP